MGSLIFSFLIFFLLIPQGLGATYSQPSGKPLSFQRLEALIKDSKVESATEAVVLLKKQFPQLFQNYILMYRSRSIQPSSFVYPRVLLVGKDARIIIAFSGDPSHPSFNALEVMEFKESQQSFEFREIKFYPAHAPYISKANPNKCLGCHQGQNRRDTDPRPNWEPYSLWPGAFGSGGSFVSSRFEYDDRIREEDHQFVQDRKSEKDKYTYFAKYLKPFHPRYRLLGKIDFRFTVAFTDSLLKLNYRRVVRLAQATPHYKHYKYAFVASAKCQYIPWPSDFEQWHTDNNLRPEFIRGSKPESSSSRPAASGYGLVSDILGGPPVDLPPPKPPKYKKRQLSESINLLFDPLGVDTSDWSTDFRTEGGRFAFRERFGLPSNPTAAMRSVFQSMEPELYKLKCEELEAKSLRALKAFQEEGGLSQVSREVLESLSQDKEVPAAQVCARCHNDPDERWIPQIPFEDPTSLLGHMKSKTYPRGSLLEEVTYRIGSYALEDEQMPPRTALSQSQRQDLLDYLKEITESAAESR